MRRMLSFGKQARRLESSHVRAERARRRAVIRDLRAVGSACSSPAPSGHNGQAESSLYVYIATLEGNVLNSR